MVYQVLNERDTQSRLIELVSRNLKVPTSIIYPYTRLKDDLNLDQVDFLLLIAELERSFNVFLSPEEAEAIETIEDAKLMIEKYALIAA